MSRPLMSASSHPLSGWSRALAATLAIVGALVFAPAALAVPPSNDSFTAPFNVDATSGIPVTLPSTAEATNEAGEPLTPAGSGACIAGTTQTTMTATTWYRIIGNGGTVSVDTAGSNFDTVISIYLAPTPTVDVGLPCDDDANGTQQSALSFDSIAGKAYLIQVGGCFNPCVGSIGATGSLVMHVSAAAPPAPPPPPPPAPAPAPAPVIVVPPDGDGDGIPDAKDACPAVKPTRDANNDGCQDKPARILSDLKYDGSFIRRGGAVRGISLSRVRLTRVPAGAVVRVICAACRRAAGRGGSRAFRAFSFTAKKGGTQTIGRLSRLLLLRGRQLVVVVTSPEHLGRKVAVRMSARDRVTLSCLAVGSTSARVACSTGG